MLYAPPADGPVPGARVREPRPEPGVGEISDSSEKSPIPPTQGLSEPGRNQPKAWAGLAPAREARRARPGGYDSDSESESQCARLSHGAHGPSPGGRPGYDLDSD